MSKETPDVPNAVQEKNKEVQTRSHITVERNTARGTKTLIKPIPSDFADI